MSAHERASRGQVQHDVLDLIDAASALKLSDGVQRAYEVAALVDDVDTLQRMAAGLAVIIAFDLTNHPRRSPGDNATAQHRARLAPWISQQRLEATWMVDS